jgi:hypothetical protein
MPVAQEARAVSASTSESELVAQLAGPGALAPLAERARLLRKLTAAPWPLLVVLAVQTVLGLRLVRSNTAYIDEAMYLYAGSQELSHWLHGGPVVDYQVWFSGSPVVYPPLGAIANAIGGLIVARTLSLCFILGTTTMLFRVADRLVGRNPALLGSALYAVLGTTQFLSGFATYDPMALFLLVLSVYFVARRRKAYETLAGTVAVTVTAPAVLALAYIRGILYTTVNRSPSQVGMGQSPLLVLGKTWTWIGVVIAAAVVGMMFLVAARNRGKALLVIGALLLLATVAAPLNQARIGTTVSLQKHVVFGAWFGCILAGYGLERLLRYKALVGAGALTILVVLSAYYATQAEAFYHSWTPENPAFISGLRTLVRPGDDRYLIEGYDDILAYYVGSSVSSNQWKEAGDYSYTDPQTGIRYEGDPAFSEAIRRKVFTLIVLNYQEPQDYAIVSDIVRYGGYRIVGYLPPSGVRSHSNYTVWGVAGGRS